MKNLILTLIITLPLTLWGQGWEQTFGGEGNESGNSVQQTSDGGYIITGGTSSFGNGEYDIYLIKTDENGNEIWNKTFGGEYNDIGFSVQQTTDGGYIITGYTVNDNMLESADVYLIKTDENGNEQWSQTFGDENFEVGYSVQQTTDGGYIITGTTNSFGNGQSDVYLIKTDENGNEQWTKSLGGINYEEGFSLDITSNDEYIICGNKSNGVIGDSDIYLMKTDGNGDSLWTKTFGGNQFELSYSVKETTDNGYIILGETESFGSGKIDFYLIKTDEDGNYEWDQTYGGIEDDWGFSLDNTSDGGFILCGITESFGNNIQGDIWLIKTNQFGNITSTFEIPLPNPNRKIEKTVNLNGQEIKHQINQPIIEIFDDGSTKKKIIIE